MNYNRSQILAKLIIDESYVIYYQQHITDKNVNYDDINKVANWNIIIHCVQKIYDEYIVHVYQNSLQSWKLSYFKYRLVTFYSIPNDKLSEWSSFYDHFNDFSKIARLVSDSTLQLELDFLHIRFKEVDDLIRAHKWIDSWNEDHLCMKDLTKN
jgi:hypothetical protein